MAVYAALFYIINPQSEYKYKTSGSNMITEQILDGDTTSVYFLQAELKNSAVDLYIYK